MAELTKKHDPHELVASIPLFAPLDAETRRLVAKLLRFKRYTSRQVVAWEGEPGGALFVALSGYFKAVTSGSEGKEVLLSVMGPGEVIGELSVLDGKPRSASIVTQTTGELAVLDREPLIDLVRSTPPLALALIGVLAERLRNLTSHYETISSQDVPQRLAQVLVALAKKYGQTEGTRLRIPVRFSQQDLGNMVGATRESVNKQLRRWELERVLTHERGEVVILNLQALTFATRPQSNGGAQQK